MEEIVHPKGKIFYSVGEVCDIFNVNASLLRFWEDEFDCLNPTKNSRGHRQYTTADVDTIRLIYHLVKEQGMTLDGAKKRIRQNRSGVNRDAEIMERLRSIRNMLSALKAEMGLDVEVIEVADEDADEPSPTTQRAEEEVAEVEGTEVAEPTAEEVAEPEEPEVEPAPELPEPASEVAPAPTPELPEGEQKPKYRIIEQTLF